MIPSINITVNVIDVVIARPIIKPVLELPLVDVVDAKKIKNKNLLARRTHMVSQV